MTRTPPDWPPPPAEHIELQKVRYEAEVQETADARRALRPAGGPSPTATELAKADWAAERELDKIFQQSMFGLYEGSLGRAQAAAELVQKSAAALGTIYAGLLALAFSVTDNPLPARATIPGLFLGFAIAFSTAYLAYYYWNPPVPGPSPHSTHRENQLRRLEFFGRFVMSKVNQRSYWLRASVLALGLGVASLPLPFLSFDSARLLPGDTIPSPPAIEAGAPEGTAELLKLQYQAQLAAYTSALDEGVKPEARTMNLPGLGRHAVINVASLAATLMGVVVILGVPAVTAEWKPRWSRPRSTGRKPGTPGQG